MNIGLVLSGGGALGAAHIGVLEQLEHHHIRVQRICGTSAGALLGLLYSAGGMRYINRMLRVLEDESIINTPNLLVSVPRVNQTLRKALRAIVPARTFADLPIDFSCIATDLVAGTMVRLQEGDPIEAVMASCAYPGIFRPSEIGDRVLTDGGFSRNFPADVLRNDGDLDFIIGSSVYFLPPLHRRGLAKFNRIQTLIRTLEVMVQESNNMQLANCDFCFVPPANAYRMYHVEHVDNIRETGRAYARREIDQLLAILRERAA